MTDLILILHNIRSTYNVGAIFRTAEGFGVRKIICSGYTPYPQHSGDTRLPHIAEKITAQIHKTALGAETMIPFDQYDDLDAWLRVNAESREPMPVIGLEQTPSSIDIRKFTPPEKFALLLGEEVSGIEARYLSLCDSSIEIPMRGRKESFNVSVAASIALYHFLAT